jgi:hypothetical protein
VLGAKAAVSAKLDTRIEQIYFFGCGSARRRGSQHRRDRLIDGAALSVAADDADRDSSFLLFIFDQEATESPVTLVKFVNAFAVRS